MNRYPFTNHPEGWYFVARSEDVKAGKLSSLRWLGKEIVAWRSGPDDIVSVAAASCPHKGASLAPEHGGRLIDGLLVCPFHGFSYDGSGSCVAVQDRSRVPQRNCKLDKIPTCEVNDMILGYHGDIPRFHIPKLDDDGWTKKAWGSLSLRTHIQEVVENVVDLNHFLYVHGYKRIGPVEPPTVDGCHFTTGMTVTGRLNVPLLKNAHYNSDIEFHLWGLGYFFWETSSDYGVQTRNWLICVPDNDDLTLHYAVAIGANEGANTGAMRFLPMNLLRRLIRSLVLYETGVTLKQDRDIWNGKSYLEKPQLISTDGAFFKYREYCQQFYEVHSSLPIDQSNTPKENRFGLETR